MEGKITDEIFSNLWIEKRRSDWALLRYSTRRSLQKALQHQGYSQPPLDRYLVARDCFKEIYAPPPAGSHSLPAPTDEQFQDMADLYNRLVQPNQVTAPGTANRATIKDWLSKCIQALRSYQTRYVVSINAPSGGNEGSQPLSFDDLRRF